MRWTPAPTNTRRASLSPEFDEHYIELHNGDLSPLTRVCQYGPLIKQSFSPFLSPPTLSLKTNILTGISESWGGKTRNKLKLGAAAADESLPVNIRYASRRTLDLAGFVRPH